MNNMNEEEAKRVKDAFTRITIANSVLQEAAELLAKFGNDVPSLNLDVLKMMAGTVNSLDQSIGFVKSFIRVSTLQQLVLKESVKSEQNQDRIS